MDTFLGPKYFIMEVGLCDHHSEIPWEVTSRTDPVADFKETQHLPIGNYAGLFEELVKTA